MVFFIFLCLLMIFSKFRLSLRSLSPVHSSFPRDSTFICILTFKSNSLGFHLFLHLIHILSCVLKNNSHLRLIFTHRFWRKLWSDWLIGVIEAGGILGLGTHDKMAGTGLNGPLNEIHRIYSDQEDCQGARGVLR